MLPLSLCSAPAAPRRHHLRGMGGDHRDDDEDASEWELTRTREKQQEIGQRCAASGGRVSRDDLGALARLQRRSEALGRARDDARPGLVRRCCGVSLQACRLFLGVLTSLGSSAELTAPTPEEQQSGACSLCASYARRAPSRDRSLLLGSLLFVSVDRATHSQCGPLRPAPPHLPPPSLTPMHASFIHPRAPSDALPWAGAVRGAATRYPRGRRPSSIRSTSSS